MSDDKPATVNLAHDREVRAIALGYAVDLVQAGPGPFDSEKVLAIAEKFRAFLTVAGGASYTAYQYDDTLRVVLPPNGNVALPAQVNVVSAPTVTSPASEAFAAEFRAFREFIERVIDAERSGSAGKAG